MRINHLQVDFRPLTFMNPNVLEGLRFLGIVSGLGLPASLVK